MIDDKYVNMLQEVGIISITVFIVVCAVLVAVGIAGAFMAFKYGYSYRRNFAEQKIGSAEEEAERILAEAADKSQKYADNIKKEKLIEAKEEIHKLRSELDREIKERRSDVQRQYSKRKIQ